MSDEKKDEKAEANQGNQASTQKEYDPYKKYKDFKWENEDAFNNGPIGDESRKCRDCCCCLIFIIFLAGCVFVAYLGFTKGRPSLLLYTYDEDGVACGKDDYKDFPYLYFYNVIGSASNLDTDNIINGVCVKTCPEEKLDKKKYIDTTLPFQTNVTVSNPLGYKEIQKYKLECKPTKNNTNCEVSYLNYYRSEPLLNRVCMPLVGNEEVSAEEGQRVIEVYDEQNNEIIKKVIEENYLYNDPITNKTYVLLEAINGNGSATDASNKLINWSFFSVDKLATYMTDLVVTKWAILASVVWSFILCLLFMLFVRCCAGFLVFLVIILVLAGLIVLALLCRKKQLELKELKDEKAEIAMQALFWVFLALALVWLIFIFAMCNRIRLAVALIEATAKYISGNCCIIVVPLIFILITVIWYGYWVALSIFLYATGDFDSDGSKVLASFKWDAKIRYSWWFHLFALFYIDCVISAYSQFVYASSACIWYFTHEKGTEDHPIRKSFKRGIRYHFGSLCFGAIIIAIVKFLMFLLEYVKNQIEATYKGNLNKTVGKFLKCILCCFECCLNCVARTMEFINKHAYIQIALKGDNFCTAAWEGFGLLVRNLGKFGVLVLLGTVFTFIGAIFVTVGSGVIGFFVITKLPYFSGLSSPILPVFCFAMIGLLLGYICMNVFGMSSDALMHAFLLDEELNKGQAKAYPELAKFMNDERK